MAIGSVSRLGGSLNEKRGKEMQVQMMEILTWVQGTGHFCHLDHLHLILTF